MGTIYLDHNATTRTHPDVVREMVRVLDREFGSPQSLHALGRRARDTVERAREILAHHLRARPAETIFTSGGTEADNLALVGAALAGEASGRRHLVTSAIEHHAVLVPLQFLQQRGFALSVVPVDGQGLVDPDDVRRALRPDTALVSVMAANNEVGTIQPVAEIGRLLREHAPHVVFHCDAVQALGKLPIDVQAWNVDLLAVAAHKVYGPKGVGALYVRKGTKLVPLVRGGHHEKGRRAGTENVAGIAGFGRAIELYEAGGLGSPDEVGQLRDRLERRLGEAVGDVRVNGHPQARLANTLNMSFRGVEGESVIVDLDLEGVEVSGGSACTSAEIEVSHVLAAMALDRRDMQAAVRFSLGWENTQEEIDRVVDLCAAIVAKLRRLKRRP
ncbi:MAG TPA: cysteine desulfurase family protein [Polyangia bacterium]|nr:cysteine desulfurase family protein [Polyangia bacterium]